MSFRVALFAMTTSLGMARYLAADHPPNVQH